ncbi:hypothetical protein HHK36_017998 [Tetracentron sinense]|uniref:Uncharacterized protein n=1 Tax=Tetracentron sinense TaxID=13715 RepID=A0A834Z338_TETSI|nr:hypothetical protein HHK36_017998 [Tetracentron sinense]
MFLINLCSHVSEFEELEAVPTMAVMEGPLEPSSSASAITDVPDDSSFVNFFSAAMNIGNASNSAVPRQPYQSPAAIPISSRASSVAPSPMPTLQMPSPPLSTSSTLPPLLDTPEPSSSSNRVTNLVKPSSFFAPPPTSSTLMMPPISSSFPTAPPLHPPVNLQRPYGTPMLQPFPPPTPPPSLTPTTTPNYGPVINRDKVRDALLMLVQVCPF